MCHGEKKKKEKKKKEESNPANLNGYLLRAIRKSK